MREADLPHVSNKNCCRKIIEQFCSRDVGESRSDRAGRFTVLEHKGIPSIVADPLGEHFDDIRLRLMYKDERPSSHPSQDSQYSEATSVGVHPSDSQQYHVYRKTIHHYPSSTLQSPDQANGPSIPKIVPRAILTVSGHAGDEKKILSDTVPRRDVEIKTIPYSANMSTLGKVAYHICPLPCRESVPREGPTHFQANVIPTKIEVPNNCVRPSERNDVISLSEASIRQKFTVIQDGRDREAPIHHHILEPLRDLIPVVPENDPCSYVKLWPGIPKLTTSYLEAGSVQLKSILGSFRQEFENYLCSAEKAAQFAQSRRNTGADTGILTKMQLQSQAKEGIAMLSGVLIDRRKAGFLLPGADKPICRSPPSTLGPLGFESVSHNPPKSAVTPAEKAFPIHEPQNLRADATGSKYRGSIAFSHSRMFPMHVGSADSGKTRSGEEKKTDPPRSCIQPIPEEKLLFTKRMVRKDYRQLNLEKVLYVMPESLVKDFQNETEIRPLTPPLQENTISGEGKEAMSKCRFANRDTSVSFQDIRKENTRNANHSRMCKNSIQKAEPPAAQMARAPQNASSNVEHSNNEGFRTTSALPGRSTRVNNKRSLKIQQYTGKAKNNSLQTPLLKEKNHSLNSIQDKNTSPSMEKTAQNTPKKLKLERNGHLGQVKQVKVAQAGRVLSQFATMPEVTDPPTGGSDAPARAHKTSMEHPAQATQIPHVPVPICYPVAFVQLPTGEQVPVAPMIATPGFQQNPRSHSGACTEQSPGSGSYSQMLMRPVVVPHVPVGETSSGQSIVAPVHAYPCTTNQIKSAHVLNEQYDTGHVAPGRTANRQIPGKPITGKQIAGKQVVLRKDRDMAQVNSSSRMAHKTRAGNISIPVTGSLLQKKSEVEDGMGNRPINTIHASGKMTCQTEKKAKRRFRKRASPSTPAARGMKKQKQHCTRGPVESRSTPKASAARAMGNKAPIKNIALPRTPTQPVKVGRGLISSVPTDMSVITSCSSTSCKITRPCMTNLKEGSFSPARTAVPKAVHAQHVSQPHKQVPTASRTNTLQEPLNQGAQYNRKIPSSREINDIQGFSQHSQPTSEGRRQGLWLPDSSEIQKNSSRTGAKREGTSSMGSSVPALLSTDPGINYHSSFTEATISCIKHNSSQSRNSRTENECINQLDSSGRHVASRSSLDGLIQRDEGDKKLEKVAVSAVQTNQPGLTFQESFAPRVVGTARSNGSIRPSVEALTSDVNKNHVTTKIDDYSMPDPIEGLNLDIFPELPDLFTI